jgi:hypothetical protein
LRLGTGLRRRLRVLLVRCRAILLWTLWLGWRVALRFDVALRFNVALLFSWCAAPLWRCSSVGVLGSYGTLLNGSLLLLTNGRRRCGDGATGGNWAGRGDLGRFAVVS